MSMTNATRNDAPESSLIMSNKSPLVICVPDTVVTGVSHWKRLKLIVELKNAARQAKIISVSLVFMSKLLLSP